MRLIACTARHCHYRSGQGLLPDNDGLDEVLDAKPSPRGGANKKRMAKDKKYGFGGPKHLSKQNDKKSLNDFSSFNPKRGKATGGKKVRFNMVF